MFSAIRFLCVCVSKYARTQNTISRRIYPAVALFSSNCARSIMLRCMCLGLALLVANFAVAVGEESAVAVLQSPESFTAMLRDSPLVLVKFYAPWCGHCKELAPKFDRAAEVLRTNESPVVLAKVDATDPAFEKTMQDIQVQGYPTLQFFRDGKFSTDYDGEHETDALVQWCNKQVQSPTTLLETEEDVRAFMESHGVVAVGFLPSSEDHKTLEHVVLDEIARKNLDLIPFAVVEDETVARKFCEEVPSLLLSSDFGATKRLLAGSEALQSSPRVGTFIHVYTMPLIAPWSESMAEKLFFQGMEYFLFYFHRQNTVGGLEDDMSRKVLEPLAAAGKDALAHGQAGMNIVNVNVNEKDGMDLAGFFEMDVDGDELPCFRAVRMSMDGQILKYPKPDCTLSKDNLSKFITSILSDTLRPIVKSAPAPITDEEKVENGIRVVVGSTFEDELSDRKDGKHVLVEFYAPWCGHCKKLLPTLEYLASILASDGDSPVLVAKLDATANDVPSHDGVQVQGFPTLYLFSPGVKPVPIEGNRTLVGLVAFLRDRVNGLTLSEEVMVKVEGYEEPVVSEEEEGATQSIEDEPDEEAEEPVDESDVLELSKATLEHTLTDRPFVFVQFYAPWCGHCKALKPEFAKAATAMKGEDVVFAKVDATRDETIAEAFGVEGFPTIKFFVDNVPRTFDGARDALSLEKWVRKNMGPPFEVVESVSEFEMLVLSDSSIVVGMFNGKPSCKLYEHYWKSAATKDTQSKYILVSLEGGDGQQTVADHMVKTYELSAACTIAHFKRSTDPANNDPPVVVEMNLATAKSPLPILNFASIHRLDMVSLWIEEKAELLFAGMQADFVFGFGDKAEGELYDAFLEAAPAIRRMDRPFAMVFVENTEINGDLLEFFDVKSFPSYRAVNLGTREDEEVAKYPFATNADGAGFTAAGVRAYVEAVVAGTLDAPEPKTEL